MSLIEDPPLVKVLKALLDNEDAITIYDIMDNQFGLTYTQAYKAMERLDEEKFVVQRGRRGKRNLYLFRASEGNRDRALRFINDQKESYSSDEEGEENYDGPPIQVHRSIKLGWGTKRPIDGWLRSFAQKSTAMENAKLQASKVPLIVSELFKIAIADQKNWVIQERLSELEEILTEIHTAFHNLELFTRQLKSSRSLWDARFARKALIEKPGLDPKEINELCIDVENNYGGGKAEENNGN